MLKFKLNLQQLSKVIGVPQRLGDLYQLHKGSYQVLKPRDGILTQGGISYYKTVLVNAQKSGEFNIKIKLLPDVGQFKIKLSPYNPLLLLYGLRTRFGSHKTLIKGRNGRINRYLIYSYYRLYISKDNPEKYWKIATRLIRCSNTYLTACIHHGNRNLYRQISSEHLTRLLKRLQEMRGQVIVKQSLKKALFKQGGYQGLTIPETWAMAFLIDYHRSYVPKGTSYRPLGVPSLAWRVMGSMWLLPLNGFLKISENQTGFQPHRGTGTAWEKMVTTVLPSRNIWEIDYKWYFPSIRPGMIYDCLKYYEVPEHINKYLYYSNHSRPVPITKLIPKIWSRPYFIPREEIVRGACEHSYDTRLELNLYQRPVIESASQNHKVIIEKGQIKDYILDRNFFEPIDYKKIENPASFFTRLSHIPTDNTPGLLCPEEYKKISDWAKEQFLLAENVYTADYFEMLDLEKVRRLLQSKSLPDDKLFIPQSLHKVYFERKEGHHRLNPTDDYLYRKHRREQINLTNFKKSVASNIEWRLLPESKYHIGDWSFLMGLPQGYPLSPFLSTVYFEYFWKTAVSPRFPEVHYLAYADDMLFYSDDDEQFARFVREFPRLCRQYELEISKEKSQIAKYQNIPQVEETKFLGIVYNYQKNQITSRTRSGRSLIHDFRHLLEVSKHLENPVEYRKIVGSKEPQPFKVRVGDTTIALSEDKAITGILLYLLSQLNKNKFMIDHLAIKLTKGFSSKTKEISQFLHVNLNRIVNKMKMSKKQISLANYIRRTIHGINYPQIRKGTLKDSFSGVYAGLVQSRLYQGTKEIKAFDTASGGQNFKYHFETGSLGHQLSSMLPEYVNVFNGSSLATNYIVHLSSLTSIKSKHKTRTKIKLPRKPYYSWKQYFDSLKDLKPDSEFES